VTDFSFNSVCYAEVRGVIQESMGKSLKFEMKSFALAVIRLYQSYISPRKGFSCAYRVHTGHASCSHLGARVIRRYGVLCGFKLLRQRMAKCGVAHRRFSGGATRLHRQAGFCDLSCDLPCDLDAGSAACDMVSGCGSPCDGCDWGNSRKKQEQDKYVYIPPNVKLRS
jgi:uncharacterized protein